MNTLIVYYSYGGNTRQIAQLLQKETGADLLEIEPVIPYTGDYWNVVAQGQMEVEQQIRPQIKTELASIKQYETILFCSPIWWYTVAPLMQTFLCEADLQGKALYPVITNGGYGLGKSLKTIQELATAADIKEHLEVVFDEANRKTSDAEIMRFVHMLKENGV